MTDPYGLVLEVFDADRVVITSDNPFRDKELIKTLPGASYNIHEHRWFAPLTWATCVTMRGIFGDRLQVGPKLAEWSIAEYENRIGPAMGLREAFDAEGDEDLYPFQRAGVQFLAYARRALLCDEMGTGKTVQTIRTLVELHRRGEEVFPAIVVAPNNMVRTWEAEVNKWWPGLKVNAIPGGTPIAKRRKLIEEPAHVYIINFEGIRAHSKMKHFPGGPRLKPCIKCDATLADVPANSPSRCERCKKELNFKTWKTVVIDEAHKMKNPKAKQTQCCWALRTDETENIFCLTGTAIANAPHDLWPALYLISREEHPSRTKYIDRYCLTSFNPFGGMTIIGIRPDTKEEFFKVIDPRMRRMPKEAVLPFLPKKTYTVRTVDMSAAQKRAYDQMEKSSIAMFDGGATVAANPLTQLTRLSQFASAYAEVVDGEVRLSMPSNKIDAMVDILEEMGDEPAVIFARSRQLVDLAIKKLEQLKISHTTIVGGQTPDEREAAKNGFQQGHFRVIICTIAAGGIGITLTRSGTAIFLERSWSMVDNSQAEDRVHRIGSEIHDKIQIIDIVSAGTVEERQRVVLGNKLDRLEEVMRDRETLLRILGNK